jgi:hypothetical protein
MNFKSFDESNKEIIQVILELVNFLMQNNNPCISKDIRFGFRIDGLGADH